VKEFVMHHEFEFLLIDRRRRRIRPLLLAALFIVFACHVPGVGATQMTKTKPQRGGPATRVYTPPPGGPERKAILDALRVPIEKELRQKIVFRIGRDDRFRVQDGWAFLRGGLQLPDGQPVDYRQTVYQARIDDGVFDDGIYALLRKQKGKWRVVSYAIGATDVPFTTWKGAPAAIFEIPAEP